LRPNPYALAIASGILLALSFPPFHLGFVAYFALVPLLAATRARPTGIVFRSAVLGGFTFGLCLIYWIANLWVEPRIKPFLVGGVGLACLYFGLAFGFTFAASRAARRSLGIPGLLCFPFFFAGLEFLRSLSHMGFPWGSLAYTQTEYIKLVQFASVTSVPGVSFWVASINLGLYFLFFSRVRWLFKLTAALFLVLAFALPLTHWYVTPKALSNESVNVALIQAGVAPTLKRSSNDAERLRILTEETLRLGKAEVDLIVWPETAVPGYFRYETDYLNMVETVSDSLITPVLLGAHDREKKGDRRYDYYNAAFLVSPFQGITGIHRKTQLVPFGERLPFDDIFPGLRRVPLGQGHFSPGKDYKVLEIREKKFAVLICFESIFPRLVRRLSNRGADFLVNITEDGWYGRTSGQYQHAGMAVLRCIENRISLARCANTGISMFIDPYGRVSGATQTFVRVTRTARLPLRDRETFYTRCGDVFGWTLVIAGFAMIILILYRKHHATRASHEGY
jgi:apolipoprotein N-acyltransferase